MAFAPVKSSSKLRLFSAPRPNYKDFSGPPDGDYVRYVDGLMLWAEQEQERQRLKSLGDKARSLGDTQWGRSKPAAHSAAAGAAAAMHAATAQPGSVESSVERWKRKAQAQAAKMQQAQKTAAGQGAAAAKPKAKSGPLPALLVVAAMVLAGMFAPGVVPVVIIAWVAFNVIRAVRAASGAGKS